MYCTQCGQELPGDARFCPACGTPVQPPDATAIVRTQTGEVAVVTATLDIADEDAELIGELPELAPGTGMLIVVRGPNAGSRYLIDRETTTVGRHPDSHIFLDDVTVSRRHAEIVRADLDIRVRDLGSLNGTYVNGQRVEEALLASGDEVQIGRFKLLFAGTARAES